MIKFEIMGKKGHAEPAYDLETAEMKFEELKKAKMVPFKVVEGGKAKKMDRFDPDAEVIRWHPLLAGG